MERFITGNPLSNEFLTPETSPVAVTSNILC
jgi:hypothetical protein